MEIEDRVALARADARELDRLLSDYLPFIRGQCSGASGPDFDDRLSVAMLTFVGCVRQYAPERGAFLPFAAACIRNRLTDEARRAARHDAPLIPLFPDEEETVQRTPEEAASLAAYDRERERQSLREEIESYAAALGEMRLTFAELSALCPKQRRAREQCVAAARLLAGDARLRADFAASGRLPQAELARRMGVSPKTIEKHRKYIVSTAVLLLGDFPGIRAFLPPAGGKREGGNA